MNRVVLKRAGLVALGLALAGGLVLVLMRSGPLAPPKVTVSQVREGSLQPSIFGVGTVEARRSWLVGPTVAGRVLRVLVDNGDTVREGQLLAEMDPVDLDQRLAALDATVARVASVQAAAKAQLADAAARRELAGLNAQRNQDLAAQHFISTGALESRLQEKTSADAAFHAAQANVEAAGQDLARARAERAALAQQRGNQRLLAPQNAVVVSRDAEAGSTVVAGQAVVRLVDPDSLWIKLRVDQGRSGGLTPGLPARIVLRSRAHTPLEGQVARVEVGADSVTEERLAHVSMNPASAANSGGAPALGEMAEVTLALPPTAPSLLVSNASVQRVSGKTGVWRVQDGTVGFVPVRLGAQSLEGQVQVLEGLQSGDTVVVYSQKALSAGTRVRVVEQLVKGETPEGNP